MDTIASPNQPTDNILTVKEVAAYLKVSDSTVYRLVKVGKLPGRKVGGTWRFSRRVVDRWFAAADTDLIQAKTKAGVGNA